MAVLEIPVDSVNLAYNFRVELEGQFFEFNYRFNRRFDAWFFDLLDGQGSPILLGKPVLTNTDVTGRFQDSRLPPGIILPISTTSDNSDAGADSDLNIETLGERIRHIYEESA